MDSPGGHNPNQTNGTPNPTTPPRFFTGWMPFLPPNQQRQSTEDTSIVTCDWFSCMEVRHAVHYSKDNASKSAGSRDVVL